MTTTTTHRTRDALPRAIQAATIGRPLARVPRVGHALAGIVAVACYLAAVMFLVLPAMGKRRFARDDPATWFAFVVCSLIWGITLARPMLRDAGGERSSDT